MNIEEFASLNIDQKMEVIWEWGFFIGKSQEENQHLILYSLHNYYVEVSMRNSDNSCTEIKAHHLLTEKILQHYSLSANNPFVKAMSH